MVRCDCCSLPALLTTLSHCPLALPPPLMLPSHAACLSAPLTAIFVAPLAHALMQIQYELQQQRATCLQLAANVGQLVVQHSQFTSNILEQFQVALNGRQVLPAFLICIVFASTVYLLSPAPLRPIVATLKLPPHMQLPSESHQRRPLAGCVCQSGAEWHSTQPGHDLAVAT